jgi:hypothetical protein
LSSEIWGRLANASDFGGRSAGHQSEMTSEH